jgi:hypothetical protein
MSVAVRRYYARNLLSVCYLEACKFPPSSQCTEEYFRIIRMTTSREGEKSYRSEVYRIFKYNQHGRVTTRREGVEKLQK